MFKYYFIATSIFFLLISCNEKPALDEESPQTTVSDNTINNNNGQLQVIQNIRLNAVELLSNNGAIAVGYDMFKDSEGNKSVDAIILKYASSGMNELSLPFSTENLILTDVNKVSDDEIWVTGYVENTFSQPVIMHYDGSEWKKQSLPTNIDNTELYSISMVSLTEGYAAGIDKNSETGCLLSYDGNGWKNVSVPQLNFNWTLTDVLAVSSSEIYVCGEVEDQGSQLYSGLILTYDGSVWQQEQLPEVCYNWRLSQLYLDNGVIYAVGIDNCYTLFTVQAGEGTLIYKDGSSWQQVKIPAIDAIWGFSNMAINHTDNVTWLVGYGLSVSANSSGVLMSYNNNDWDNPFSMITGNELYDIKINSLGTCFAVGKDAFYINTDSKWGAIDLSQFYPEE